MTRNSSKLRAFMRISPCHRIAWGEVWNSLVSHSRVGNTSSRSAGTTVVPNRLLEKVGRLPGKCNQRSLTVFPIRHSQVAFLSSALTSLVSWPCCLFTLWRKTQMCTSASIPFLWWCPEWTSARHQSHGWTHIRLSSCPQGMPLWDGHTSFSCAAQAVCPNPEWVFHSTISGDVLLTDVAIRNDYGWLT